MAARKWVVLGARSLRRVLGRFSVPIAFSEETQTVFVGPVGAQPPYDRAAILDPDGPWELVWPVVPDAPPEEGGESGA